MLLDTLANNPYFSKKVSGIYGILNLKSRYLYVGSSYDIKSRVQDHAYYLRRNKHDNIVLQRAWNKYGEGSFCVVLLEVAQKQSLIDREQFYIDLFTSKYNLNPIAGRPPDHAGKELSEEHKRKIGDSNKGKVRSPELRVYLSEKFKGRYGNRLGATWSNETREKNQQFWTPEKRAEQSAFRKEHPEWVQKAQQTERTEDQILKAKEALVIAREVLNSKPRTPEHRLAQSLSLKGRKGTPHTEESKRKISDGVKKSLEKRMGIV